MTLAAPCAQKQKKVGEELSEYEKKRRATMAANEVSWVELEKELKAKVKLGLTVHVPGERKSRYAPRAPAPAPATARARTPRGHTPTVRHDPPSPAHRHPCLVC